MKARINKIDEHVISQAFRNIADDGTFNGKYVAYWGLVKKYGIFGVHYLERFDHTNPILGIDKSAAFLVAKEWRDKQLIRQQRFAMAIAFISALTASVSAIAAWYAAAVK